MFTRSSKRPAIYVYFEYICWKFAGRLLNFAGSCKHPFKEFKESFCDVLMHAVWLYTLIHIIHLRHKLMAATTRRL